MKHNFTLSAKKHANVFILALACVVTMQNLDAQVCSNPNNIFGVTANGAVYPINITNAAVGSQLNTASYATSPSQSNAIGYNTINGKFYYFKNNPTSSSGGEFVAFDPILQTYTTLATSPVRTTVHAGCVSFNGTGYYCDDINGNLFFYNIVLNTWTTITSTILDQFGTNVSTIINTQNSGDMAIDGLGNLWIVTSSSSNYALYKIPTPLPTTAQTTVTAKMIISPASTVPSGSSGFQGIAFNASGQLFLSSGSNKLYELTNTTTLSLIGTLSTSGVGNDLTSCSFPFGILPITWSSFSATLSNNQVSVKWSVEAAMNTKGFYVERSNDNKNWDALTYVAYDESQSDYSFVDGNPANGNNYYRVHQVDYNNNDNYSTIKSITISSSSKIAVWPNPARDVVNIQDNGSSENLKAQLFDQFGRMISTSVLHQGNNAMNVSTLPAGTYIMHVVSNEGSVYNEKIIKK